MKKLQHLVLLFCFLPCLLLAQKNNADTTKLKEFELPTAQILATWAGQKTPMAFTNLSKEQLEKENLGQDIPNLIRLTPSIVESSDAGTGIGYTGVRIRGSDPTRINVTLNGIPLNDSESQSVYWVDLPDLASSTESIQIQRGVGTSTNGSGAFGGTISLNTNKLRTEPFAEISGTVGSFQTQKESIAAGSGLLNRHFSVQTRLSNIYSGGFIDRAFTKLNSVFVAVNYLGEKNSVQFNCIDGHEVTYQAWNGVPAQYINDARLRTYNTAGTEKSGSPHPNEVDDYRQTHYQLLYNQQFSKNWRMQLALHYTKGRGFYEQYKSKQKFTEYNLPNIILNDSLLTTSNLIRRLWLDNDFYGTTYSIFYENDEKLNLVFGGGLNNYEGNHYGEINWIQYAGASEQNQKYYQNYANKLDFNTFVKINYQLLPKLNVFADLQYRYISHYLTGIDRAGFGLNQENKLHFFNPKMGFFYDFSDQIKFFSSLSVANREPNRDDFAHPKSTQKPISERMLDWEIGFQQVTKYIDFGVNYFLMYYQNQLAVTGVLNDVGAALRVNIPESYRMGLELQSKIKISNSLIINANTTFSRNKIKVFTEYIDNWDTGLQEQIKHQNTDLAFSPNIVATAEVEYKPMSQFSVAPSIKYVAKQYLDNSSNSYTILNPYSYVNLRLSYSVHIFNNQKIDFKLLINNVLNQKYESNGWAYRYVSEGYDARADNPYTRLESGSTYQQVGYFPQAGRHFLLAVKVSF